jgi:alginate O-acetyltransferase complex protein AlgI
MLFTEPSFLFAFLPALLIACSFGSIRWKNLVLTVASLVFYALGELHFLAFLVASIALNYGFAWWIEVETRSLWRKWLLALALTSDLGLLLVFKYARFFVENMDVVLHAAGHPGWRVPEIVLPLGISFFTFHKMSYKIDIYRRDATAQRNPLKLALYILFFPQLIAGPIVRYHEIAGQLDERSRSTPMFAHAVRRFIVGLAKKMIVANSVALIADRAFAAPLSELSCSAAWLGIVAYTTEIYFDFSGYSDMAIGLAEMFGFHFPENFNYPYTSTSITDFWRRWHMSLSNWFRDYLYIPLGGNRRGPARTYFNLVLVFFLCGLWHGASWNFIAWGLYHGLLLVLERVVLGKPLARSPVVVQRCYALLMVMVGWVLFRATTLADAVDYLGVMSGTTLGHHAAYTPSILVDAFSASVLAVGFLISLIRRLDPIWSAPANAHAMIVSRDLALGALLVVAIAMSAAGTYNPFLYFRF